MNRESGDTLVEVLIATAILAAAVVGGLGIMNFGFGVILNSVERTQVQAEMTSQISMARYARDAFVRTGKTTAPGGAEVWDDMLKPSNVNTAESNMTCNGGTPSLGGRKAFYIEIDQASGETQLVNYNPAANSGTSYATPGAGMWMEVVRPQATDNYIDIYVKACWQPAAGNTNEEAKTLLRLYVP